MQKNNAAILVVSILILSAGQSYAAEQIAGEVLMKTGSTLSAIICNNKGTIVVGLGIAGVSLAAQWWQNQLARAQQAATEQARGNRRWRTYQEIVQQADARRDARKKDKREKEAVKLEQKASDLETAIVHDEIALLDRKARLNPGDKKAKLDLDFFTVTTGIGKILRKSKAEEYREKAQQLRNPPQQG